MTFIFISIGTTIVLLLISNILLQIEIARLYEKVIDNEKETNVNCDIWKGTGGINHV